MGEPKGGWSTPPPPVGLSPHGAVPAGAGGARGGSGGAGRSRGLRWAVGAAVLASLAVLAGVGWVAGSALEALEPFQPTPLTEEQLSSLLLTTEDLRGEWWELPPEDPYLQLVQELAIEEQDAETCGARLQGPMFAREDETAFATSLAFEACGAASDMIRRSRSAETEFLRSYERHFQQIAEPIGAELVGFEGGEQPDDFGDDVYMLEVTGVFRIEGQDFSVHVADITVYADHGAVSAVFERLDSPVQTALRRDAVSTARERLAEIVQ